MMWSHLSENNSKQEINTMHQTVLKSCPG